MRRALESAEQSWTIKEYYVISGGISIDTSVTCDTDTLQMYQ